MESDLTFEEYINHLKFMETNVITDSSIHRTRTGDRTDGPLESSTLNDYGSNSTQPLRRVSNTK